MSETEKQRERIGEEEIKRVVKSDTTPDYLKDVKSFFHKKNSRNMAVVALVVVIFLFGFWVRSFPARFNELQALDPFLLYRYSDAAAHQQLPETDMLRHHPFGFTVADEFVVPIYLPAYLYVLFGQGMPFLQWAIIYPALMGALAIIVMFFIGRELYDTRAGLFAAFFLATIPAFITRTSAGFFDKEPTFGLFMLLTVYFFVASWKRESWIFGVLGGVFLGTATISSGIGRYIYIFYFLFAIIMLLLNRHKRLLYSYGPAVVFSAAIQLLVTKNNIESTFFYIFAGVLGILIVRELIGRFRLVKDADMKYVVPAILLVLLVGLGIGSMFSDRLAQMAGGLATTVFVLNPNPIGYTVAEQQAGNWGSMSGVSGLQFSQQVLPQVSFLTTPFSIGSLTVPGVLSIFFFMLLGIVFIVLKIIKRLIKERELRDDAILLLPLIWSVASIWGVFLFIRLTFIFGPPAALMAGLFLGWVFGRLPSLKHEKLLAATRHMPLYLAVIAGLIVVMNSANAYVYANNLGPSICIPNPQVLIEGQRCLDIDRDGNITFAAGQPWYEAMGFLRELPAPKNVLTWWDFGHWFNTRGKTPSVSDGGKGPRKPTAEWYTAPVNEWDSFLPYVRDKYKVTHILQDYTLTGKYGAITAIATDGKGTVGIQQFNKGQSFQQGNTTVQEFTSGNTAIWLPVTQNGGLAGSPMLLVSRGGQYAQNGFINDVCTPQGIVHTGDKTPSIGGCVAISSLGVHYIPEIAKNTIFVSLQFMDGTGLPVKKVFDNQLIKIYEIQYGELNASV